MPKSPALAANALAASRSRTTRAGRHRQFRSRGPRGVVDGQCWLLAILFILSSALAETATARKWVDSKGRFSLQATFVNLADGKVTLKRNDNGKKILVPLASLSPADQVIARIYRDQKHIAQRVAGGVRAFAVPAEKDGRNKIPDTQQESASRKVVADLFADQVKKAIDPATKAALAREYLRVGMATSNDVPAVFVLFQNALNQAIAARDGSTIRQVTDALATQFAVDRMGVKSYALARLLAASDSEEMNQEISQWALTLIDQAVENKQLKGFDEMFVVAIDAARASGNDKLLGTALREFDAVIAMRTVADDPDNPDANLVLGRYYCFSKGDWKKGLPLLSKGSDIGLSEQAKLDLADPRQPDDQVVLGEAWNRTSERLKPFEKKHALHRGDLWRRIAAASYKAAMSEASGLDELKIKKKLDELIKKLGNHAEANVQLTNMLIERGHDLVRAVDHHSIGEGKKLELRLRARGVFKEAETVCNTSTANYRARLKDKFPKGTAVKKGTTAWYERNKLRRKVADTQMIAALIAYDMATTAKKGSEARKHILVRASGLCSNIATDYSSYLAGHYGRMYEGRCYQDLGDHRRAIRTFSRVLQLPEQHVYRDVKGKTLPFALQSYAAVKLFKDGITVGEQYLAIRATHVGKLREWRKPQSLDVRYHVLKLYMRLISQSRGKTSTYRTTAVEHAKFGATCTGKHQADFARLRDELLGAGPD